MLMFDKELLHIYMLVEITIVFLSRSDICLLNSRVKDGPREDK